MSTIAEAPTVVDSMLPIDEEIRRFAADLPTATRLDAGSPSRDALVRRFVDRLVERDTAGLRQLVLTRAEFAHLIFPSSSYTRAPYRTSPRLVWMQLQEDSRKGLSRLLRPGLGVKEYLGHDCPRPPVRDGASTLWRGCTARVRLANGGAVEARLFGVIVEREGRFKFASLETDF